MVPLIHNKVKPSMFNPAAVLPYQLRTLDFQSAMQDVYDFFFDVDEFFISRRLPRLEDTLRKALLSGTVSDMLSASMAKHSRNLVQNRYHNGHPDLIVGGLYPNDTVKAGEEGVEIKSTRKAGGAVDTHGGRKQWMCVFVYAFDDTTEPAYDRKPLSFREVYLAQVEPDDFRVNNRGALGTRTSTLDRDGVEKLRAGWIYWDEDEY